LMAFEADQVRRLARLARIALSEAEVVRAQDELKGILGLIERLQAVDTAGVEPMSHPGAAPEHASLRLREDRVTETDRREAFQPLAPAVEEGLYLVPRVIE